MKNEIVIPTASKRNVKSKHYNFDHITSTGFMQISPVMCMEVAPNQRKNIALDSFSRLNPLVKPTFGRARVFNRMVFVPYRTVMPHFTEFLKDEPYFSVSDNNFGLRTSTPLINNKTLLDIITYASTEVTVNDPRDLTILVGGVQKYFKLTNYGVYLHKLILSLGYRPNYNDADTQDFTALPFLCWIKALIDWYYPSNYINNSVISAFMPYLQNDSLGNVYVGTNDLITCLLGLMHCAYSDDLYVNAWDRPVAPNNGTEANIGLPDITLPAGLKNDNGDVIVKSGVANDVDNQTPYGYKEDIRDQRFAGTITEYQHQVLKALTNYTQRHRLSSVRAVDRYFSEYGINLSSEIMKRSILIDSQSFDIQFGDVMAHSDTFDGTDGAVLGDYAGKGVGYGNHVFKYDIGQEFGILFVINTIVPEVQNCQGINRITKHITNMDFYHGDFDGLGVVAAGVDEVYIPDSYDPLLSLPAIHDKVFGFIPRYSEYKWQPSLLTGLFGLPQLNQDLLGYYLMRDNSYNILDLSTNFKHDVEYVQGTDASQYNRIFYNDDSKDGDPNNFNFIHHFEVESIDDMCDLYDTYDFGEFKKAVKIDSLNAKVN